MRALVLGSALLFSAPLVAGAEEVSPFTDDSGSAEESVVSEGETEEVLAAWEWMELYWKHKAAGEVERAWEALEGARTAGADLQLVALEAGYLELSTGATERARGHLELAAEGKDPELAAAAKAQLSQIQNDNLEEVFAEPSEEDKGPQFVALTAAYRALEQEDFKAARSYLIEAKRGEDELLAKQARDQLRYVPKPVWADVYFEGYSWVRFTEPSSANLVPTVRLRGFLHPIPKVDLDPYVFVQLSRDVASRVDGGQGYPLIYADNHLMVGGGIQFRFWKKRVGLFAQAGPAFNLVRSSSAPLVQPDVRVGAFFALSGPKCDPAPQKGGVRKERSLCGDLYSEAVYVSRFDHNLLGVVRGRLMVTYLMTGPVAWEPYVEGRILKDIRNDYWNNLADAGLGHRWRLIAPLSLQLLVGVHGGGYFGLENVDPAPDQLGYAEFRVQLSGYATF